jgi:hypothetical protein
MRKNLESDIDFFAVALHQIPVTVMHFDEIMGHGIIEKYTPHTVKLLSKDGANTEYFFRYICTFFVNID